MRRQLPFEIFLLLHAELSASVPSSQNVSPTKSSSNKRGKEEEEDGDDGASPSPKKVRRSCDSRNARSGWRDAAKIFNGKSEH